MNISVNNKITIVIEDSTFELSKNDAEALYVKLGDILGKNNHPRIFPIPSSTPPVLPTYPDSPWICEAKGGK
jgi:hypothetical protein